MDSIVVIFEDMERCLFLIKEHCKSIEELKAHQLTGKAVNLLRQSIYKRIAQTEIKKGD